MFWYISAFLLFVVNLMLSLNGRSTCIYSLYFTFSLTGKFSFDLSITFSPLTTQAIAETLAVLSKSEAEVLLNSSLDIQRILTLCVFLLIEELFVDGTTYCVAALEISILAEQYAFGVFEIEHFLVKVEQMLQRDPIRTHLQLVVQKMPEAKLIYLSQLRMQCRLLCVSLGSGYL